MSVVPYQDIRIVHLELTNKCNALCPQCSRSVFGMEVNPNLDATELKLEDIKKIFPPEFVRQLHCIVLNGNHGDSAAASELIPILDYFKTYKPNIIFNMHSNGGLRSPGWWSKLSAFFKDGKSALHFGFDGLEDTNHLYRVNVNWERAWANAKAFLEAGGRAYWDYIVFKHNEHQVSQAKELADQLGFAGFIIKKTGRFATNHIGEVEVRAVPVYRPDRMLSHLIEPPLNPEFSNEAITNNLKGSSLEKAVKDHRYDRLIERNLESDNTQSKADKEHARKINNCSVDCIAKKRREIFVDFGGRVFPCCWSAWPFFSYWNNPETIQIRDLLKSLGGLEMLSAKDYPIKDIVSGPFFGYVGDGLSDNSGERLLACSLTCGKARANHKEELGSIYT